MTKIMYPPTTNRLTKQLNANYTAGATTLTLNNTTNIQNKPGVCVVNRIDTSGSLLPAAGVTYFYYDGTSGATLTGVAYTAGSTDQDHAIGEVVEFVPDITWGQMLADALATVVDPDDVSAVNTTNIVTPTDTQTLTNKTIASPTHTGTTTQPKVQGAASSSRFIQAVGEYDNGNSGTSKEIDWANGDRQKVTLTGDCTFTFANAAAGQTLTLRVVQDGSGSHTATWPTLMWPGGSAGTPGTGASDINLYIFYFDGTNYLTQLAADFS